MSTINVDNVLPETGTMVNVNGANTGKNAGNTIQITSGSILRSTPDSVFIGDGAGQSDISSGGNTFVGKLSGQNNQTGYANTFLGAGTGNNNITGTLNTYVGWGAGQQSTQDGNTYIGWSAGNTALTTTNTTCIGANAQPSAGNASSEITLGNPFIGTLRCAATTITAVSDGRDKKDIVELPVGLDFVKTLKPVTFVWNDREYEQKRDIKDFGFIAQDLKQSQEDAGLADTLKLVYESNPEKLEASYGKLIPILVKAIQDLTAKVEALEFKNK
jgi:hypothetical protein